MPGICLITTSYPGAIPGQDAAGSFVEDFATELAKSVRVSVVAASREDSITRHDNLTVRRFAVPQLPLSLLRPQKPADWKALYDTLRAGRRATNRSIREDRPDHVLALWALPCGWWADMETRHDDVPFSTWALGSDIWSLGRLPLIKTVLKRVLRRATHRYADGLGLCADVERLCKRRCDFLPSSRRLPPFRETTTRHAPPYRIAFLGRWHPNKGADLLTAALCGLDDGDWNRIEAVRICGGGPLADDVNAAAEQLAAAARPVEVGAYLGKSEAAQLIDWADYLLLPSRIESIPVIFSDAAQLGTPLIATPVGDLPRLHDRYGFGVLAGDVTAAAITEAIRSAIRTDPTAYHAGLEAARRDFDVELVARRFLAEVGLR